jgi:hypothetical protein
MARMDSPERKKIENLAQASWMAFLVPVFIQMGVRDNGATPAEAKPMAVLSVGSSIVCGFIGIAAAIGALRKVREFGRERIANPAVVGLVLNSLVVVVLTGTLLVGWWAARPSWREYASTSGRFRASLPGTPVEGQQTATAPNGSPVVVHSTTVKQRDVLYKIQ